MSRTLCLLPASLALLGLLGCTVQSRKGANGDKDVAITTPLGGMSVRTDAAAVQTKLGVPLYPGATPEQKHDKSDGSADVNMDFGSFHLRVLAMGFDSTDSADKVSAFYKKALSQYSDVITCRDNMPVGTPVKTGLGLTCKEDEHEHGHVSASGDHGETQLKAGSGSRQHIVAYKASDTGTHFELIVLELPGDDKSA